jgi:hypothetical protein
MSGKKDKVAWNAIGSSSSAQKKKSKSKSRRQSKAAPRKTIRKSGRTRRS